MPRGRRLPVPTRAGWAMLGGGAALVVTGRVLAILELMVAGAAGMALALGALVLVAAARPRLDIERTVRPGRVHVGSSAQVRVTVTSTGRWRSPLLALVDPVGVAGTARLRAAPIAPGARAEAGYRLPTEHRGILTVGPLAVTASDPLGLAARTLPGVGAVELTVLPAIERLVPLPFTIGSDPLAGSEHPRDLGRGGEDFHSLRAYVVGDDLRRVHWPSSARSGDLLVRQDEQPWQGRLTVLLDVRRNASDADLFERMVSAAASVIESSRRRGDLVRLITSDGVDTGFGTGHAHIESIFEELSVVQRSAGGALAGALGATRMGGGSLVAVLGAVPQGDLDAVVAARSSFGGLTLVHLPGRDGPTAALAGSRARRGHVRIVRVGPGEPLAPAWNAAMGVGTRLAATPPSPPIDTVAP